MSLYAVQNDEGEWLGREIYCDESDWFDHGGFMWNILSVAEENMKLYGGHVVKLGEEPTPIVVSEDEDKVLKKAKNTTVWRPASVIAGYAYEHEQQGDDEVLLEDRLMRAYVIGWTVEKPKHYVLPMEGTTDGDGDVTYMYRVSGRWNPSCHWSYEEAAKRCTVTQADIDAAPDWVKAIKPVEVTDDEQ